MDLTNDIKTDLNGASLFFPSVCLICPPHSSYYTRTMSGPWWIPAAFTPAPFRWTFQRDRFMEMSSCNFSFRMYSLLKLPDSFSAVTTFFLPLYERKSYYSYISNLAMVSCLYDPKYWFGETSGFSVSLCSLNRSVGVSLASVGKFWIKNKVTQWWCRLF